MPTTADFHASALPTQRFLRVNNVCRRLDLRERTVRWLAKQGRIPARKIDGKSWGFLPEDIEAYQMERDNGRR